MSDADDFVCPHCGWGGASVILEERGDGSATVECGQPMCEREYEIQLIQPDQTEGVAE